MRRRPKVLFVLCSVGLVVAGTAFWWEATREVDTVAVRDGSPEITSYGSDGSGNWECGPHRGEGETPTWAVSAEPGIEEAVAAVANAQIAPVIGRGFLAEPGTISFGGGSCGVGIRLAGAQHHGWMQVYDGEDGDWRFGGISAGRTAFGDGSMPWAAEITSTVSRSTISVLPPVSAIQGVEVAPGEMLVWFAQSRSVASLTADPEASEADGARWTGVLPDGRNPGEDAWLLITWVDDVGALVGFEMVPQPVN